MKYFIQWLIVFSLILLGLFVAVWNGLLGIVNDADITKLSFAILILFLFQSIRLGVSFAQGAVSSKLTNSSYFFSETFTKMGFIGTITGFIYALYHTFMGINVADMASTQAALICMGTGMGTALFTTFMGLVCSLLLRIQIYIYEKAI